MRRGYRCGCDIEGPDDDGMRGLRGLSPHRRLRERLRPYEGYSVGRWLLRACVALWEAGAELRI